MREITQKIFFSGIGGSGVSAIAGFMADKGHIVSGSDRAFDNDPGHFLKQAFLKRGITIYPQDGSGINSGLDMAVFSTAVEPDHPEIVSASELGVRIKFRPEYLAEITSGFRTIAVSGTSGKSTTSAMLAFIMKRLGLDPNYIGGGRIKQFKSDLSPGNSLTGSSEHLIIEACESDGTIVNYIPEHSIILNLSLDHHTVDKTSGMFKTLISNTAGKVIINGDDENLRDLISKDNILFSIDSPSGYRAEEIEYGHFSTMFTLKGRRFTIGLPGKHNLYNALSCIALLSEIGISAERIEPALAEFKGIDRRFDIHLNDGENLIIDDYAHNPHKIESLMQTIRNIRDNVCYIFQPHGFGPTRLMKDGYIKIFSKCLREGDHLILLPIYYAGGTISRDISSNDLAEGVSKSGKHAEVIEDRDIVIDKARGYKTVVVFGARDETLSDFAKQTVQSKSM